MTASTAASRSGSSASPGTRYGIPAALIFFLARTIRWAIVGSGTRNARAICGVSRPPRSRSVSATWAVRASAGWQQVKISRSRSSFTGPTGSGGSSRPCRSAACACRSCRDASLRSWSMARFLAVVVIHAARVWRHTGFRPPVERHSERVLDRLFGDVDVAEEADQGGDAPAVLVAGRPGRSRSRHRLARLSPRRRPGTGGPRPDRRQARRSPWRPSASAASRSAALITQKPPSCSLVSANGPSVVTTSPSLAFDDGRGRRRVQAAGEHPGASPLHLLVEPRRRA